MTEPFSPQPVAPQQSPTQPGRSRKPVPKTSGFRDFVSTVGVLGLAILVAFSLIAFVFQSYEVDGPSMESTLQDNDRLIVWKLPRTWARVTGNEYVPKRGDVIVFIERGLASYGQPGDRQLIKRVIGLPGDRVVVNNNVVTVYNKQNPNGFIPDQTLPYGKDGRIPATLGNIDVTLTEDQLFVCGDNRPESLDSRSFGPIQLNDVVGKLAVRVLPLSSAERF